MRYSRFFVLFFIFVLVMPITAQVIPDDVPPNVELDGTCEISTEMLDMDEPMLISVDFPNFRTASLRLPFTTITLNCASLPQEVLTMDVSPSVPFDGAPPRPSNPEDVEAGLMGYGIVNVSFANMRSGPGLSFERVGVVSGATRLVVLGRNADDSWWYVQVGEVIGWISDNIIALRGDLRSVPVVETDGPIIPPTLYVGFRGNLLRTAPNPGAIAICPLLGRTEFEVYGRNANGDYYYIKGICLDGSERDGWLNSDLGLLRNPSGTALPVLP